MLPAHICFRKQFHFRNGVLGIIAHYTLSHRRVCTNRKLLLLVPGPKNKALHCLTQQTIDNSTYVISTKLCKSLRLQAEAKRNNQEAKHKPTSSNTDSQPYPSNHHSTPALAHHANSSTQQCGSLVPSFFFFFLLTESCSKMRKKAGTAGYEASHAAHTQVQSTYSLKQAASTQQIIPLHPASLHYTTLYCMYACIHRPNPPAELELIIHCLPSWMNLILKCSTHECT